MTADDIPASLAEAMAEIRRLRARIAELDAVVASNVVMLGTLEQPTDDAPFHLEHDVPPSTPR